MFKPMFRENPYSEMPIENKLANYFILSSRKKSRKYTKELGVEKRY